MTSDKSVCTEKHASAAPAAGRELHQAGGRHAQQAGRRAPDGEQGGKGYRHHGCGPKPVGQGGAAGMHLQDVAAHHACRHR